MSRVPKYVLLSDWDNFSLGDICKLRSENYEPKKNGTLKYIGLEHIESGIPIITNFGFETDVTSVKHRFYPYDILYGKLRPYLDKVVLSNIEGISSSDILILKAEETKVLPNYLIKLLHHNRFLKYATSTMTGTTLPRTNWKALSKFVIFLPKIAEQKKVVSVLENIDNLIQITQLLMEKLQECKKGILQRLFTEGIGHTEFKDTKLGRIPEEWEIVKLKDTGSYEDGDWILSENFADSGIRLLQIGDIGIGKFLDKTNRFISKETAEDLKCKIVKPRTQILLSRMPQPIGRSCIAPKLPYSYIVAVDITIGSLDSGKIDLEFMVQQLNYSKTLNTMKRFAQGATRQRISRKTMENIKILLPSLKEQEKIVFILKNLDNLIEKENNYKKKLKKTKMGLSQVLLTGNKRVPI